MRAWQVARWFFLVAWALAFALLLARFFSGPEDGWIRDASGNWVAHGHPAGPSPAPGYRPPLVERAMPLMILALFALGLFAAALLGRRAPAGADALSRGIRYFGAVSIMSTFLAISIVAALAANLASGLGEALSHPAVVVICLLGAALALKLLSWHAESTKKVLEAHYDLKRQVALLQEAVEGLLRRHEG